jgi:hypothetical protein
MIVTRESLRPLVFPGLVALVLVASGIALLTVTDGVVKRSTGELERARGDRLAIQTRLSQATDEERQIRERLVDYQRLRDAGVIGEERRLDWIETIKEIRAERRLYEVKYSIEARRPVDYPGFRAGGNVEFMVSRMRLDVTLLHEEDLLNLLQDMKQRLQPYVVPRSCRIDRIGSTTSTPVTGPRLRAECSVDLITIRDRAASL